MDLLKARPICGTYGRYWQLYEQRANAYNVTATEWANHIHDGVWSLTQALHQTLLHNPSLNLSRHHRGDINTTALIRSKVEALNFTGVSRQIAYNASTGYSTRAVNVFQAGDALTRHVGSYHPRHALQLRHNSSSLFLHSSFPERRASAPVWLAGLFTTLTLLLLALVAAAHGLTLVFREKKPVKASSVRLGHLVYTGCYVLAVGTLCLVWRDLPTSEKGYNSLCHLSWCSLFLAFTLVLAIITVKAWRLYRIFTSFSGPQEMLSNGRLMAVVGGLCLVQLVVCAAQTAVDPRPLKRETQTVTLPDFPFAIHEVSWSCGGHIGWTVFHVAILAALLLTSLLLPLLTRHNRQEAFRLHHHALFGYSTLLQFGVALPLYYLSASVEGTRTIRYTLLCVTYDLSLLLHLVFLCLSPLHSVLRSALRGRRLCRGHPNTA